MTRPIYTNELEYLRSPNQASKLFLALPESHIVFEAHVHQAITTTDSIAELTYDTVTSGYDYADILPGMTVWFGPVVNDYSLGIARVRKVASSTKIYIGETSDLHLTDGMCFTVVDDFLPWSRHGRQHTDTTSYADYDISHSDQYAHPHPIVNIGADGVIYKPDSVISGGSPASIDFNDMDSFLPDGSAIDTHLWEALGTDITIVNETTATPTYTVTRTGTWKISDTITGTNGKSTTAWRTITAYDQTHPPVNQFNLTQAPSGDVDSGGWSFSVRMYDQAAFADVKDRQQVILFARDWFGDITSLTASDISFDAATKAILAGSGLAVFLTNTTIRVSGSTNNDGIYTVKTGSVADEIDVNEALIDEAAGASITISVLYAQTEVSLGPLVSRENIVCMGWIAKETLHYDPNGAYVDFTVQGPAYWLNTMTEFILGIEDIDGTSSDWSQMHHLSVDKGLAALLYWRSTVPFISDVYLTGDTRALPSLEAAEGSLWQQIKVNAFETILATVACNRYGQLYVFFDPNLTPSADRGSILLVMTTTEGDTELGRLDIERDPQPRVSQIAAGGVAYSWGSGGIGSAKMAFAPGHVFKQWGSPDHLDRLLVADQAQLNSMTALYIAKQNNNYPIVPINLVQNNRFIDIAPAQYVHVSRTDAENPRVITFDKDIIPARVALSFDAKGGFITCQVSGEAVTVEDLVITGSIPAPAPPETPTPPIPFPPFPPIPWPQPNAAITYTWVISTPAIGGIPGPAIKFNKKAISLDAYSIGGTIDFNIEYRLTIGSTGTPLFTSDVTAPTTGYSTVSFDNPNIPIGSWLFLKITGSSGAPTDFVVTLGLQ